MSIPDCSLNINEKLYVFSKKHMTAWRKRNKLPEYVNASYSGFTGVKAIRFPTYSRDGNRTLPDITKDLFLFEEEVLQEIKNTRKKPFGFIRALWKMCQNLGTAEAWDTKFLPQFPGRSKKGHKQYARYKGEIVSGNDISNRFFGHICAYMGIPVKLAQLVAKLDACGILEPISKGKFPSLELLKFRDTASDQLAIFRGVQEFNINDYRLK